MFFTPRFIKNAKLLLKGVTRFIDYKRDVLPAKKLEEIEGLKVDLVKAIKERSSARIDELTETINKTCERALPEARQSSLAENVEVFFVSIVIAMGIRTYIAQPFQIPTGSMQPTLNGIIAERRQDDFQASFTDKALGWLTGTSYVNEVADQDGELDMRNPLPEHQWLIFRPYCLLHYADGHTQKLGAPIRQLLDPDGLGFVDFTGIQVVPTRGISPDGKPIYVIAGGKSRVKQGQPLARGVVHNGDHVIVNKFAYHFRTPTRGEVFVFTTKNIAGIDLDPRQGSQHYIKRLGGLPGDDLDIKSPNLFVNGKLAEEPGFRRVMSATDGYNGYQQRGMPIKVRDRSYVALGDNSYNSSDSRYWGFVPQQNLVGCGSFCYWPLTKHWGPIH